MMSSARLGANRVVFRVIFFTAARDRRFPSPRSRRWPLARTTFAPATRRDDESWRSPSRANGVAKFSRSFARTASEVGLQFRKRRPAIGFSTDANGSSLREDAALGLR